MQVSVTVATQRDQILLGILAAAGAGLWWTSRFGDRAASLAEAKSSLLSMIRSGSQSIWLQVTRVVTPLATLRRRIFGFG